MVDPMEPFREINENIWREIKKKRATKILWWGGKVQEISCCAFCIYWTGTTDRHTQGYCSSQAAANWHDLHPDQITLVEGHRNQPHIHNKLSRHLPIESYHWAAVSLVGMLDIVLVTVLEETSLFIMKMGFPKQVLIPTNTLPNRNMAAMRQTTQ